VRILFLGLVLLGSYFSNNKILFIISTPRCLSTVTFRMFAERNDFTGFHEASLAVYNRVRWPVLCAEWFHDETFRTFDELQEKIFTEQKTKNVVVKEMIFTVGEFVGENEAFLNNPDVHFLFLVRHPYWIIHSLEGRLKEYDPGRDFSSFEDDFPMYELCAINDVYNLYHKIKSIDSKRVHVAFSDQITSNPKRWLNKINKLLDLKYDEASLNWKPYSKSFDGKIWHEQKQKHLFHLWHGGALYSDTIYSLKNIIPPKQDEMFVDQTKEIRDYLMELYLFELPYYEKFLEEMNR